MSESIRAQIDTTYEDLRPPVDVRLIPTSYWDIHRYVIPGTPQPMLVVENRGDEVFTDTQRFYEAVEHADVIVLWDDNKSSPVVWERIYQACLSTYKPILVDSSDPQLFTKFPDADLYKISLHEWTNAEGEPDLNKSLLIVTSADKIVYRGTYKTEVIKEAKVKQKVVSDPVDTIGAGDVVLSRLAFMEAQGGETIHNMLQSACSLARASVHHEGCYFPREEL